MVKTSNKRKSVLLTLSFFAFVALVLISCSADSLMSAGETMGKLSSGGFGKAGNAVVSNAAESVANFSDGYDKCFTSRDALFFFCLNNLQQRSCPLCFAGAGDLYQVGVLGIAAGKGRGVL